MVRGEFLEYGFDSSASTAPSVGPFPRSTGSSTAARLREQALQLEEVQAAATRVAFLEWESPAGRNFRDYLGRRSRALAESVELLRTAARLAELYEHALLSSKPTPDAGGFSFQ